MKKERFKFIASVYVILVKDDKILLLRRFNTGFEDGNYSFPAGHVDGEETLSEALIREIREEIGIYINQKDPKLIHVMQRLAKDGERFDFFFECKNWKGEIDNKEPHKCNDLRWVSLDNLPKNTIPYIKQAIHNYKNNIIYSDFGY